MKRMERTESLRDAAREFVLLSCSQTLRQSQAKALSVLVCGALGLVRGTLIGLAVCLAQHGLASTVKGALKRVWRFVDNDAVEVHKAIAPVWQRLLKKRRKKLLIALDWTDIQGFKVLVAAACIKGRAIWLVWKSVPKSGLNLNMSRMEQELLLTLKGMLPPGLKVIILADRGFFKTRLFAFCQKHNLHYVIRIKPDFNVQAKRYRGNLLDLPVAPGMQRFWKNVVCGSKPKVTLNLVIYYQRNLPQKRDEPWFLATDLSARPGQLVSLYGKRMQIEQCFRDTKSLRNGLALRHCLIKLPERLDRWLLILMLAYLLVCGLGLWALRHLHPRYWGGSSRKNECSIYTAGSRLIASFQVCLDQILQMLAAALREASPKWG